MTIGLGWSLVRMNKRTEGERNSAREELRKESFY